MSLLFWITTVISIILMIVKIKRNSENIYILIGVYIPLIMYFFRWSNFIDRDITSTFYYIFIIFNAIMIISNSMILNNHKNNLEYNIKNIKLLYIVNISFIGLYLIENYIGSRSFFPSFKGIDIHTFSASGIAYFTRNMYCIMVINILFYIKTNKKRYLFMTIILFLLPIISRGARMAIVTDAFKIFLLGLFIYNLKGYLNKKLIIKYFTIVFIALLCLTSFTNYRMKNTTSQEQSYSQLIQYTGPNILKSIIPVYYGYFPLSYDNLNINLKRIDEGMFKPERTYGLYTFKGLFFSVFQLHRVAKIDPNYVYNNVIYNTGAAIVPTMFYEMYYDYGIFIFIPIIIFCIITVFFRVNKQKSILYLCYYFFYVPSWSLAAFQNVLASATVVWGLILLTIFVKIFIKEVKYD